MRRAAREAAQTTASHRTEMILAALYLALHGEFGFGQRRCIRVKDCMGVEIGKLESL